MRHLILYAEDDEDMARLYTDDLNRNGFNVVRAKDGREAISLYGKHPPDIVLLDIDMPGLTGFQVMKLIREKDANTPIIFLTSYSDSKMAVKGLSNGADDYIRKNVDFSEVLAHIHKNLRKSTVRKDPVIHITPLTSLDMARQILSSCGNSHKLSFRDCDLLQILALNKNVPQKRAELITQLWGQSKNGKDYMSKSVSSLRQILSADESIRIVANRSNSIALMADWR
jgi:DNA-binding response OmpR family regulator